MPVLRRPIFTVFGGNRSQDINMDHHSCDRAMDPDMALGSSLDNTIVLGGSTELLDL